MFDKEAIQQLTKAESISAACAALVAADSAVPLPDDFKLHDIEQFMPNRRRLRGTMTTSVVYQFAAYAKDNAEAGARVFVNPNDMTAEAVLNIGTPTAPGHGDNRAVLAPRKTAAYTALGAIAAGRPLTQTQVAEFMEDWEPIISCMRDDSFITNRQAIGAVRNITIEALKKLGSQEAQLSASRSTFEQVTASSANDPLPTLVTVRTVPLHGLAERAFSMRLAIVTGDKPTITLRIVNPERHAEEMAAELAALVGGAIGESMPVILGSYSVKS